MRFFSFALISSLSLMWCSDGISAPVAYSNPHGALVINNPTTSTVMADSEESRIGWVLPPTGGQVEAKGFMPSANLGFCPGVKTLHKTSNNIMEVISRRSNDITELANEIEIINKRVIELDKKIASYGNIDSIIMELNNLEQKIKEKKREKALYLEENNKEMLIIVNNQLAELNKKYDYWDDIKYKLEKTILEKKLALNNKNDLYDDYKNSLTKINELRSLIDDIYKDRVKIEGGHFFVDYNLGWEENLIKLKRVNPHYEFKQTPTTNARVFANFVAANNSENYFASLPLLLDYSIAGIKFVPWGTQTDGNLNSLPNIINGDFRINLLGACPIQDKNFFDDSKNGDIIRNENGYPLFGIHLTYNYPVLYNFKAYAKYNLYKMYEEIKKRTVKGGFFSRKSYVEHLENTQDKESCDIEIKENGVGLTFKEKLDMAKIIKNDLMEKIVTDMGQPVPKLNREVDAVLPQGKSGAIVISEGFRECGYYSYCRVAGWFMMGIDSIWGSREAETYYKSTYNKVKEMTISIEHPMERSSSTGFERPKSI